MTWLTALFALVHAAEITVEAADDQTVVVLVDEVVKGQAPIRAHVDGGEVTLAFRPSMFGPVLFSERVTLPAEGTFRFVVDLKTRSLTRLDGALDGAAGSRGTQLAIDLDGVKVRLDGKDVGEGPLTLDVEPGRHQVELLRGCEAGSGTVFAEAGTTTPVRVELEPLRYTARIRTEPAGARILVDGDPVGEAPVETEVRCGERKIEAVLEGYRTAAAQIAFHEDRTVELTLEEEAYGSLEVDVRPDDALVRLDGKPIGKGKVRVEQVAVGPHTLTVEHRGKVLDEVEITVKRDAELAMVLVVDPTAGGPPRDGERLGKRSVGRLIANTAFVGVGAAMVPLGFYNYNQARLAYDDYLDMPGGAERDAFYRSEVAPRQTVAFVEWGVGGALVVTGTALWIHSLVDAPVVVVPGVGGAAIAGRF